MGFLEAGQELSWEESRRFLLQVKFHGIRQFIHTWTVNRHRSDDKLKWGEELELTLIEFAGGKARLWEGASGLLSILESREEELEMPTSLWHPEFASHMIEALPAPAYEQCIDSFLEIEASMLLRREKVHGALPPNVSVTSLTVFPNMGVGDWICPPRPAHPSSSASASRFIPDSLINPHPRFATLVRNIRSRRGAKIVIVAPLFEDHNTKDANRSEFALARPLEVMDRFSIEKISRLTSNPVKDQIYMDTFAFGMGMSCVQMTYLSPNMSEARWLYDQFAVLSPLWLALTASAPFFRGMLANVDSRWDVLSQSVDCRTTSEMTLIPKSRFSSVSLYISDDPVFEKHDEEYNDFEVEVNKEAYDQLCTAGVDPILAKHIAYLWIRDPMVIFSDRLNLDDRISTEHFENIQSTNWNSVRFKLPPPSEDGMKLSPIGWRVEFRTPDIQLTDFENAASCALLTMIRLAILRRRLDFYIPITKLDENFARATKKDAITEEKFWFRHDVTYDAEDRSFSEMTVHEILFGTGDGRFSGLMKICFDVLDEEVSSGRGSEAAAEKFREYSSFIGQRTSGALKTNARFLRDLVRNHEDYGGDSRIPEAVNFEVARVAAAVGKGQELPEDLFGSFASTIEASVTRAQLNYSLLKRGFSDCSTGAPLESLDTAAGEGLPCRSTNRKCKDWETFCKEWCGTALSDVQSTIATTEEEVGDCRLCEACKLALMAESEAVRKRCCEGLEE